MTFQSKIRILWLGLIVLMLSCAVSAGPARGQGKAADKASLHVTPSRVLHQAVRAHAEKVVRARSEVSHVLNLPEVREQVRKFGLEPDRLQQKVAALGDSEILELQSQIMPLAQQMEVAAQDGSNRKKVLLWVLVGVVAALTIAMFLYYS